jgi:hypothetical protein
MKCYTIISKVVTHDNAGAVLTIVSPTSGSPLSLHIDKWDKIQNVIQAVRIAFGTDAIPHTLQMNRNHSGQVEYTEADMIQFKAAVDQDWLGISLRQVPIPNPDNFGPNIAPAVAQVHEVKTNWLSSNLNGYINLETSLIPSTPGVHDLGNGIQKFRQVNATETNSERANSDIVHVRMEGGLKLSTYKAFYGEHKAANLLMPAVFKTEPTEWVPITIVDKNTNIQKIVYFPTWEKI